MDVDGAWKEFVQAHHEDKMSIDAGKSKDAYRNRMKIAASIVGIIYINSTIRISGEEKITDAFVLRSFATNAYMISVTKNGLVKKTAVREYEVSRNNKTMSNMKLLDGDAVVKTMVAYAYDEDVYKRQGRTSMEELHHECGH